LQWSFRVLIGIIGQGFVGSAIREGLKNYYSVMTYDLDKKKCNATHKSVCENADIIFVCLPTPMRKNGKCDTRILETAIKKIDQECSEIGTKPNLVIKSTVPPGTTDRINKNCALDICFSPEFLTEANSFDDFKNQTRIIVGGKGARKVKQMFRKPFPKIPIVITKAATAETVKYFINCFLASKVTFANQMYDICEALEVDYDKVCEYALLDSRLGRSHWAVPGPDGDRGFGGHCFPKDLEALIYTSNNADVDPDFLMQVKESNMKYRNIRDWVDMKGRAVSDD